MSGGEIDCGVSSTQSSSLDPDGAGQTASVTRDTSVFRSGASSWKCNSGASNVVANIQSTAADIADGNSYFMRGYFNASAAPSSASTILGIGVSLITGVFARLRTDGTLELLVNSAVQGSASTATITDGNWHRVELKATATATTTWTASELLLDGASVATWTGSITRGTNFAWGYGCRSDAPGANKIINVDDIAINNSSGSVNNSYPGSGRVVLLKPTVASLQTGWTNDAGNTTNVHNAVNNTPPAGIADTTSGSGLHQARNATSNANVNIDMAVTDYLTAGIVAADTINAVQAWAATGAPVTTNSKHGTLGIASNPAVSQVSLSSTGTAGAFWAGAAAGTYGGGWKWSPSTMSETPAVTLSLTPTVRVTQVTSNNRIAMVCGMFMYVEYTPGRISRNPAIDFADPAFF